MSSISDQEMQAAIERYNQAKIDGTLDEKFPVIGNINDLPEDPSLNVCIACE